MDEGSGAGWDGAWLAECGKQPWEGDLLCRGGLGTWSWAVGGGEELI